jgi:hypothetical protein
LNDDSKRRAKARRLEEHHASTPKPTAPHRSTLLEVRDHAESAADWPKQAMLDGMAEVLDPVSVAVEAQLAQSWTGD